MSLSSEVESSQRGDERGETFRDGDAAYLVIVDAGIHGERQQARLAEFQGLVGRFNGVSEMLEDVSTRDAVKFPGAKGKVGRTAGTMRVCCSCESDG